MQARQAHAINATCLQSAQQPIVPVVQTTHTQQHVGSSRRHVLYSGMMMGLLAAPMQLLGPSTPAHASAIGDFLRSRQRADGGGKLIAPLKVAEKRLQNAQKLLKAASASSSPSTALNAVLQEVRNASLNCYIFEVEDADSLETKTSVMTQQMGISDPCTLRLVVKTVTNLSSKADKDVGYLILDQVIASYQRLDRQLVEARNGVSSADAAAFAEMESTLDAALAGLVDLTAFVKKVLDV